MGSTVALMRSAAAWRTVILDAFAAPANRSLSCRRLDAAAALTAQVHDVAGFATIVERIALTAYAGAVIDALAVAAAVDGTVLFYAATRDLDTAAAEIAERLPADHALPVGIASFAIELAVTTLDAHLAARGLVAY